jgi:hypothetical protein
MLKHVVGRDLGTYHERAHSGPNGLVLDVGEFHIDPFSLVGKNAAR